MLVSPLSTPYTLSSNPSNHSLDTPYSLPTIVLLYLASSWFDRAKNGKAESSHFSSNGREGRGPWQSANQSAYEQIPPFRDSLFPLSQNNNFLHLPMPDATGPIFLKFWESLQRLGSLRSPHTTLGLECPGAIMRCFSPVCIQSSVVVYRSSEGRESVAPLLPPPPSFFSPYLTASGTPSAPLPTHPTLREFCQFHVPTRKLSVRGGQGV